MAKKITLDDLAGMVGRGFGEVNGKLREHDHRFNEIDNKLKEHDQRFDRIESMLGDTINRVDNHSVRIEKLEKVK